MGLFNSLKGKVDVGTDNKSGQEQYGAPQGPPPSYRGRAKDKDYTAPSGPPPSHRRQPKNDEDFVPPSGPPPSHHHQANEKEDFAPPPGPPPPTSSKPENPPPYHDWTVIPDTSLLPPPPALPQDYSPANNASYDSAARAHEWCARNPVYTPSRPTHELHLLANAGHISLEPPPAQLRKYIKDMKQTSPTTWHITTQKNQQDASILTSVPVYFACEDNPLTTRRQKTIYFEITVQRIQNENSGIAIGFAAKPYPPWRLPGWHRASFGVHGDDGRRFVNDSWGGRDFVGAFKERETVGVGMMFETQEVGGGRVKTRAFFTRDGRTDESWSWDIDEERDERDEGVGGLMGEGDLYPAIGFFGGVEFEVKFGDSVGWRGG